MVHQEVFRFGSLNPLHSSCSAVQYQIRSSLHFPLWRRNRRIAVCLLLTVSARRLISEIVLSYFFGKAILKIGAWLIRKMLNLSIFISKLFQIYFISKLFSIIDLRNKLDFTKYMNLKPGRKVGFWKRNDKMSLVTSFNALSLKGGVFFKKSVWEWRNCRTSLWDFFHPLCTIRSLCQLQCTVWICQKSVVGQTMAWSSKAIFPSSSRVSRLTKKNP